MISTQHCLVMRLQRGASDSDRDRFYALYEKPVLAFAAAPSLNEAECCDVLQETMVKMLRGGFSRFDPAKGRFTTFLFNIAKCCVFDAMRRGARRESRHVPLDAPMPDDSMSLGERLPDGSDTPADAAERQAQLFLVFIALDFLIERKCFQAKTVELFKAVTIDQKNPQEVALAFHTSAGNVYEEKRAVLAKLKSILLALDEGMDLEQALAKNP